MRFAENGGSYEKDSIIASDPCDGSKPLQLVAAKRTTTEEEATTGTTETSTETGEEAAGDVDGDPIEVMKTSTQEKQSLWHSIKCSLLMKFLVMVLCSRLFRTNWFGIRSRW